MTTLLYMHPSSLEHDTGPGHPESIARMRAIMAALEREERKGALVGVERREPPQATRDAAGARAHGALRRCRAARRAGLGTRAPRPRHRDVAGLGRGGAARGRRGRSPRWMR